MVENNLWEITYKYLASHIDGTTPMKNSYKVIGKNEIEAIEKADEIFKTVYGGEDLLKKGEFLIPGQVTYDKFSKGAKIFTSNIKVPKIEGEDLNNYSLRPIVGKDRKTIEYIVNESPTQYEMTIDSALELIEPEYHEEFKTFVAGNDVSKEFMNYLSENMQALEAVEIVADAQVEGLRKILQ